MTRQQYIAELTQLLFYMTPWDKAKALDKYSKLFEESENEAALFNELGSPMKLAVTLHRTYEPTPEPTGEEEPVAEEAPVVAEAPVEEVPVAAEAPVEEVPVAAEAPVEETPVAAEAPVEETPVAAEVPVEETPVAEEAPVEETPVVEEAPVEETPVAEEAPVEETPVAEEAPVEETPVVEERPVEETPVAEEAPAEETPVAEEAPAPLHMEPGREKIFSEIYSAATDAQSAVAVDIAAGPQTVRKPRYLILIPYTIFAVLLAVPVVAFLAVVNVVLFAAAFVLLLCCLYLLMQLPSALGFGNMLIYGGLAIIALAATVSMGGLGVWFAHAATAGFPRFLLEIARKHGYREVEVQ